MPLKEKVQHIDLALYNILRHPVLCGEFIENLDRTEYQSKFEFHDYQKEMLCDFNSYVGFTCARSVGKTVSLSNKIVWVLINKAFPNDQILYTVPNKVHLEPVWLNLVRMFRSNSLLKNFVQPTKGMNSVEHRITLLNNSELVCRIAGQSGTGANVIGLHIPLVLLDEHGYYPWGTWIELQPTLNTFTKGFQLIASGVPTGLRENNVCWHVDMENSSYTKHRVSAYQNPRFTEEDEQRAIEQYGGKDTEDFVHLVLGEHGAPIFSVFDRRLFEISSDPVYKLTINGIQIKDSMQDYITKLSIFPQPPANSGVVFGIDLGYTDPTAIVVLYRSKRSDQLKFHGRIQLNKVSYPIQEKLIDYLDTKLRPSIIGIDRGASGVAVIQRLLEADEYMHKNFPSKLIPIEFSSWTQLGFDSDGKEIKSKTKPLAVSVLQEYSNNHRLIYSSTDSEMIAELERMTYSKNPSGDISYKTLTMGGGQRGQDHFTSALLCATLAYYLENENILPTRKIPKLVSPSWF